MKHNHWYTPDLQLFAGEGEGAAVGESGETAGADAGQQNGTALPDGDADTEFSRMIEGRFKDAFTRKTQAIIDKRFRQTKELESYKQSTEGMLGRLYEKYGVAPGDAETLHSRMEESTRADEAAEQTRRAALRERLTESFGEAQALKEIYPDFDLGAEMNANRTFTQLVLGGVPLKTAYECMHHEEILGGAMSYTAQKVREQVVRGIETRGMRPPENGFSSEGGFVTKTDVGSLTSQDILKILKQVENGEHVSF